MSGTMSQADLVADLKESMRGSAEMFKAEGDADWIRFLNQSLPDMQWKRPRTKLASVTLVAGTVSYSLAAYPDFAGYKTHNWGAGKTLPKVWEPTYPGPLPRISAVCDAGDWALAFDPAPSDVQVAVLGSTFQFWYYAEHTVGAAAVDTTVVPADRTLLLMRAQAEALMELTIRNAGKPVALRDGFTGQSRQERPRALFEALLKQFQEAR